MSPLAIIKSIEAKLKTAIATGVVTSNKGFDNGFVQILEVATIADRESSTMSDPLTERLRLQSSWHAAYSEKRLNVCLMHFLSL